MSKYVVKKLKELLDHLEYYNEMNAFPYYDTDYVERIRNTMEYIEDEENKYDTEPVEACANCKSLYIVEDEEGTNLICMKCNSINEVKIYDNIYEYKKNNNIWD